MSAFFSFLVVIQEISLSFSQAAEVYLEWVTDTTEFVIYTLIEVMVFGCLDVSQMKFMPPSCTTRLREAL